MKVRQLDHGARRSFVLVLETGDEAVECLRRFAEEHEVEAGRFTGLGAFSTATLGFFDPDSREYEKIEIDEQVEVVTLVGNFATFKGEAKVHPHAVLGDRAGRAFGGHLLSGRVRPTLEVVVTDEPASLRRETDEASGLPLIAL